MKLRKLNNGYYSLYDSDGDIVASNNPDTPCSKRLSKQNCDEIFEIFDVRKLAREYIDSQPDDFKYTSDEYWNAQVDFKNGFNKAMELNKDKLFTENDIFKAIEMYYGKDKIFIEIIQSLQQPKEIEVEIDMKSNLHIGEIVDELYPKDFPTLIPKLDENGCLILKKK